MSDVRSLLRSEQASRRISHPHLTYTRTGQLNCTACNLFIKSASLWEGHLRSANHRKNAQRSADSALQAPQVKKRKMDDSDDEARKRSRGVSEERESAAEIVDEAVEAVEADRPKKKAKSVTFAEETMVKLVSSSADDGHGQQTQVQEPVRDVKESGGAPPVIDEDEWAAFEREVAPLTEDQPSVSQYSATIVAAPVSAAELSSQPEEKKRPSKEIEAEEEKEDEERRLEEELDVMEEMEERVRKMKEKREALRKGLVGPILQKSIPGAVEHGPSTNGTVVSAESEEGEDDDDDDDEIYDWGFR